MLCYSVGQACQHVCVCVHRHCKVVVLHVMDDYDISHILYGDCTTIGA